MSATSKDKELLNGLARNEYRSVDTIYRENFTMVQNFVLNNNGSTDDARDIFQEAMVVLFEKSKDQGFELTCQLKTYIYSICRRLWLKKLQQQSRYSAPLEDTEEVVAVEDEIELKEQLDNDFDRMEHSMRNLGEPCKSLLEAFYIQKKQMVEIAMEFGYTNADNAKNQKYKCLMRLKKLFFTEYNR